MESIQLTRQERGKLAETIVTGLHSKPVDSLTTTITEDVHGRYPTLVDNSQIRIKIAEFTGYHWTDRIPVSIPTNIGWRPDFILLAEWKRWFQQENMPEWESWQDNSPPFSLEVRRRRRRPHGPLNHDIRCTFRVYYPIEVKSGQKKTLTEQQATAIPRVVKEVEYVHPVLDGVDLDDLPGSCDINVEMFSDSARVNDQEQSRYSSQ